MTSERPQIIRLNPADNVAVAVSALEENQPIQPGDIRCRQPVPPGHKVALASISRESAVIKYGQIIGFATCDILAGEHVHTHNMAMKAFDRDYAVGEHSVPLEPIPETERATFDGFLREDGRAGTRNYIGVIATVSCSSGVAHMIAAEAEATLLASGECPNVDGVVALGHGLGCCMPPEGEGLALLRRTIAGYARNPNFGGILLIGLGCEVNLVDTLMSETALAPSPRLHPLTIQASGGTEKTVAAGMDALRTMLPEINAARRQPLPASHLILGLECGGSDAYSGITANPALGAAVDLLVRHGGTAVLSETPEIYGAEHLLTRRATNRAVGEKLIERIRWWEEYTFRHGAEINNNPTPGNKAGGLTTILEKSLGAVAKAGAAPLTDVYRFAEPITASGLVFMDTPGYDVVSITGMIAGGANMICFTTGRGTVCGFAPVPTLKLATNTDMYDRMSGDMDINCGRILDGEVTLREMGGLIFKQILETASGRQSKSEAYGFGRHEFVPWHMGAVL